MVISVILSVALILIILGIIMYNSQGNQIYPAILSSCPDYYSMNPSGKCVGSSSVWTNITGQSASTNLNCNMVDFSVNTQGGTGPSSGLCNMKKWANDCNISWDGITNNTSLCYN